ncbi:dynein associated protein-domain-containing protein [Achaetomium macrosporum]|uniref:Dynein associated protein-domain-containing protein n=1 Tax=Achaetomium macrosporum TaxID=79813 RepID=A0AAN7HCG4_9PEZI|nr:dynein associated protein-domain-containing protein [Achaetomium macrosporum]
MSSIGDLAIGQKIHMKDNRTATIRFLGQTSFAPGDWVGIELDDDSGKNDGSVQGERYFECQMGRGMFVRPSNFRVVDQPGPLNAAATKITRPASNAFNNNAVSRVTDANLARRKSLNDPSPTPAPRPTRPPSGLRSPTRSPTKQLSTAPSSSVPSRTTTPSKAKPAVGARPRPSVTSGRGSMAPPPIPAPKQARQVSTSAAPKTTGVPTRTLSGRLPTTAKPGASRPSTTKHGSASSVSAIAGVRPANKRASGSITSSPKSSDSDKETGAAPPATTKSTVETAAAARPAAKSSATNKEIEDLKAKLRVLEKKRIEDREKLATLDTIKGERDKFERIIQTLTIKYQPQQQELADLKRQLKEAEARISELEEKQAEHDSALEMATLDREIAEEMAERHKAELEDLKQKNESLELDVQILREEKEELCQGMSSEDRAKAGWLHMQKDNERLRGALINLRDISKEQERELNEKIKSMEQDLQELETLKEQFAACKENLAQKETAIEDLREQLNNALGAEEMIENLTERNMNLSEEIKELKAVISDLQELKDINDELEINHIQNAKELQQEIDAKDAIISDKKREIALHKQARDDMEYTLSKFRELVTSLQSDLADMRASHAVTEKESEQLNDRSRAMLDLNMKLQISAAKAQAKTIDLELRHMEAQEAEQHLEIVKLFLPDSYQTDKDSVLALLRFKRLGFKANLLNGFIKERVSGQPHPGHEDDVFEGCGALDKLNWVSCMCDRFVSAISHCSLEQFANYQGALYELEPAERALNGWIDGLRRDELKEKQCSIELQRTIALMTHLGEVHISNDLQSFADDIHMRALLMQSYLESAAVAFTTTKAMVQRVVPSNEDDDELTQYFLSKTDAVVTQTRSAKVIAGKCARGLEDLKMRSLSLLPEAFEVFEQCESTTAELADMARRIGLDLHQLLHDEGRTEPYTYAEVQSCIQNTAATAFNSVETDLFSTYLNKLRAATSQISDLAALSTDLTQTQEFERGPAPWVLRSQELKELKKIPIEAEAEVRRLKDDLGNARRTIAILKEDLSTAQVKIETLESRMRDAKAKASRISELEAQIDSAKAEAATLSDTITKQDRELKALELDRDKWKQVASSSSRVAAGSGAEGEGSKVNEERAIVTARVMDGLQNAVQTLQATVRYLREDNRRARLIEQPSYDWLAEPLSKNVPPAEQHRAMVGSESKAVLRELVNLSSNARVYDLARLPEDKVAWKPALNTPQYHAAKQTEDYASWKSWQDVALKKGKGSLSPSPSRANRQSPLRQPMRPGAAQLQIRLPQTEGKVVPGMGGEVQVEDAKEWEGIQGRYLYI